MKLTLTQLEREILQHRLDVPDAIAEVLSPEENEGIGYDSSDVDCVCELIELSLPSGKGTRDVDLSDATTFSEPITFAVLRDCVEGSTYHCDCEDNVSPQRASAIYRAGDSLADKVAAFIGADDLTYPSY